MENDTPTDFISRFHNLEGDSIGDRKKSFFKLLRDPSLFSNEQQVNNVLKSLHPKSYLERLFKIDALIHFKQTDELMEILKQGNEVFISRILKSSWFFEEAFREMDAETVVNELLPCTSYAVRMKSVKMISRYWSEIKMDALYDYLATRYGIYMANTVLHKCSTVKIKEVLKENEIKLRPNQVKHLVDKDIELFKLYLDQINPLTSIETCSVAYEENKVLKHVAFKNPKVLLELEKNEKIKCRVIGRRMSKKIVNLMKDDILNDPERYTNILNKSTIVRKFGIDFRIIYRQLFPKKFNSVNMNSICNKLLVLHPMRKRWELFHQTYSEVFPERNIEDILPKFDESFLKLNPTEEFIIKWADVHYKADEDDDFLKYFQSSIAIPLIESKINVTSDRIKRRSLVMLLLETCAQHDDLDLLSKVLKYICTRHRNENYSFRETLAQKISDLFKLKDFNGNHWECINDQIKIGRMKEGFRYWDYKTLLENHLEFLFKHEEDHTSYLVDYINDNFDVRGDFDVDVGDPSIKKKIFLEILRVFPEVVKSRKEEDINDQVYMIFRKVFQFSNENSEYCIHLSELPTSTVPFIVNCFTQNEDLCHSGHLLRKEVILYHFKFPHNTFLEKDTISKAILNSVKETRCIFDFKDVFKKYVLRKNRSGLASEVLTSCLEKFLGLFQWDPVHWLLENEPKRLVPYIDEVIGSSFFDKNFKLYTHFGFDKKACDFYKEQLKRKDCRTMKGIFENLKLLLSTDEFVDLVEESYLPQKDKLDLNDENMRIKYNIQCEVAGILHTVEEPYKTLTLVMKFCVGDYLQSALPSLYGVFYKSPEKLLYHHVNVLKNRGLSARKHAVYLSCEILNQNHVFDVISAAEEKKVSNQKYLFSATLKYFQKNPSQEVLNKIIDLMRKIDKNDSETLESVTKIKIPRKYRTEFIEKCWKVLESLQDEGVKVKHCLESLLKLVSMDIARSLSPDFVEYVIGRYFVSDDALLGFDRFIIELLKYRKSERTESFPMVFERLSKLNKNHRSSFMNCFINISKNTVVDMDFINTFSGYWNGQIPVIQSFKDHFDLKFFLMRLNCRSSEEIAREIVTYLEGLISGYGLHIFEIFKTQLKRVMEDMDDIQKYCLFLDILKFKCTTSTCILVLELMDHVDKEESESEVFEYFSNTIELLRNISEPVVKIYYELYLSAHEETLTV